jgi:hypothetical protein
MLAADNPLDQVDILNSLYHSRAGNGNDLYDQELVGHVNLSQLRRAYENNHVRFALDLLNKRKKIAIDPEYTIHVDDPNLSWNAESCYLDLFACVSRDFGLEAFIPNEASNHHYEFQLNLKEPFRQFKGKHIKLGFDSTNAMLWIGKSRGYEDVWIGMADEDKHMQDVDIDNRQHKAATSLRGRHYRQMVLMFAYMLKAMQYDGIILRTDYPDVDSETCIWDNSNIL